MTAAAVSAIGSYVVVRRQALAGCLALARNVRTETKGTWIKQSQTVGRVEFDEAWREAAIFPIIPESALRATLGILARTVAGAK